MNISLYQIIFGVFPESLLLMYVGLGLVKVKTSLWNYFKMGFIYAMCFWIIRLVLNVCQIHSLILCLVTSLIFNLFLDLEYNLALLASLLGMIILILGEVLVGSIIIIYFDIDMVSYTSQGGLNFIIGFYLMKLPLLIIGNLIYFFNFNIKE